MSREKNYYIKVQNKADLANVYTLWVNEDEYAAFWEWWRREIKSKRPTEPKK